MVAELGSRATVHRYDHGYHMLLRDLDAATVWQDAQDWVFATKPASKPLSLPDKQTGR